MTEILLAYAKTHWLSILIGLVSVGIIAVIATQHIEIDHYKTKVVDMQTRNDTLARANTELRQAIDKQNDAIQLQKAEYVTRAKAAQVAITAAQKVADMYKERAKRAMDYTSTGDECADAKKIVNGYYLNLD